MEEEALDGREPGENKTVMLRIPKPMGPPQGKQKRKQLEHKNPGVYN